MKPHFNKEFIQKINTKITEIESVSEVELVPMIVKRSSTYFGHTLILPIILSTLIPIIAYYLPTFHLSYLDFFVAQIFGLVIGYFLTYLDFIKKLFISHDEMNSKVLKNALAQFLIFNLHITANHNGMLIFISLFERKIKIIFDKNIKNTIDKNTINSIVTNFTLNAKTNGIENALEKTLDELKPILEKNFKRVMPKEKTLNELEDKIIINLK